MPRQLLLNRNAKIVATLGPSSDKEETIRRLIDAGIDVARLNFSHGTYEDHANVIKLLRKLSKDLGKPITILQDLQGPKIRVGLLTEERLTLIAGKTVYLSTYPDSASLPEPIPTDCSYIPVDFPELIYSVHPQSHILLDDGHLELEVIAIKNDIIQALVLLGGLLSSHKGINLPGTAINIPGFTEKDRADLKFGLEQGIDAVAISFVQTASDIDIVRNAIKEYSLERIDTPIIAKLERPEALLNLEEIMLHADGVMVARGDLGVEMSPASVPIAQKTIIESANRHGKLVITATQMLDSMIQNPRPTRAEASDVANAIFDGTDAVMLSGETAAGKYPVESVEMMASIICEAENNFTEWGHRLASPDELTTDDAVSITRAARELAHDRNVAAIAVFTQTGRTAELMAKARPRVPILGFTPEIRAYQRLGMIWGVVPFLVPYATTVETMLEHVETAIRNSTDIQPGQQFIMITGFPIGLMRLPNFALLHTVGEAIYNPQVKNQPK